MLDRVEEVRMGTELDRDSIAAYPLVFVPKAHL